MNGNAITVKVLNADTARDSLMLGGKSPSEYASADDINNLKDDMVKYRTAVNLLDNSDFKNPVAQAGINGLHGTIGYACDRWMLEHSNLVSAEQKKTGMLFSFKGNSTVMQKIKLEVGKTYTAAFKANYFTSGSMILIQEWGNDFKTYIHTVFHEGINVFTFIPTKDSLTRFAFFGTASGDSMEIEWAALYEGSYTIETLPPYVPKGYGAELAECLLYFERLGDKNSDVLSNFVYVGTGAKAAIFSISFSPKRIKRPSLKFGDASSYRLLLKDPVNASTYAATSIVKIDDISVENPFAIFRATINGPLSENTWLLFQRQDWASDAYIDVNADL